MHGVVIMSHVQTDKVDEVIRIVQERIVPTLNTVPGIRSWRAMVDRATGRVVAVGEYESETAARDVGTSELYQQAVAALGQFLLGQPVREIYEEVAVFEA